MNFSKAIYFGLILWASIFIELNILKILKLKSLLHYYILYFFLTNLIIFILSYIYFKGKTKKGFAEGLNVGFLWLIVSLILDFLITIPIFSKDYSFLVYPQTIISRLLIIVICIINSLKH